MIPALRRPQTAAEADFQESPYQVVEVTTTHAGAYTGRQLAEAGLPVLRVELLDKPTPLLPPMTPEGFSAAYLSLNGKKENIRVDRASEQGRALLAKIITNSSVFVTDVPDLFTARSALVTCHLHVDNDCVAGDLPSNDILIQAMSGALSMTGHLKGPPAPIGIPVGDIAPGLFAAIGVLFALVEEIPQTISVHSLDATVSLLSYLGCSFLVSGTEPGFAGSGHPFVTPYGAYRAKDGYIIVAPGFTQVFWQNLCRMLGRPELIDDARFRTFTNRRNNRSELQEILGTAFAEKTVDEWEARLDQADVPNGPIRSFRQALEHPVTNRRGMITQVHGLSFLSTPLISNTPIAGMADRPLGARGWRQALEHLGITGTDVTALARDGVVRPCYTPFSQPTETKKSTQSQRHRGPASGGTKVARIVDLTRMLAGPFGTMILGDLGFEIIKVEEKTIGDYTRHTPPYQNGLSAYFFAANRNKKSIIVDLKRPDGRNVILDLVRTADAVVENFRPGVMEHLGLDYERLMEANPRIILVSVNGFGSTGPLRDKTSFDLVAQAMSGAMALTTPDDDEPIKPAIPLGDVGGGLFAALGVVRALLERKITGRGKHLEVSLLDAMLAQAAYVGEQFLLGVNDSERPVRPAPNGVFPTADGFIAVGAYTDLAWAALCKALEREQWQYAPRFRTMADRANAAEEIQARVRSIITDRSTAHWLQLFSASGVPACPIANLQMVFDNPELEARGMLPSIPNMLTGPLRTFGNPIRRHDRPYRFEVLPPPLHGQHTEEILSSLLACSPEKIKELLESGAVTGLMPEPAGARH